MRTSGFSVNRNTHYWRNPANPGVLIIEPGHIPDDVLDLTIIEMLKLKDQFEYVIIFDTELNEKTVRVVQNFDLPNVILLLPGALNIEIKNAVLVISPWWLVTTMNTYRNEDLPADAKEKPYHFEAMYGMEHSCRRYIKAKITEQVPEYVYQTEFLKAPSYKSACVERGEFWEDDIVMIAGDDTNIMMRDFTIFPSQVLPKKIYAKAAYSVICETNVVNEYSFFTEKIAKPIIASRMFIVFSGQYYLRNLRKLGFKTFDGIIDESYDLIEDHYERFDTAVEEMRKLTKQNQMDVLNKCLPIVKHNNAVLKQLRLGSVDEELNKIEKHYEYIRTIS